MISIITPTIRPEALNIVAKGLSKQKYKDFEWLIGSPSVVTQWTQGVTSRIIKDDFQGGFWTLNRIYNKLFKEAKGELIVSLQDSIYIPSDGLQKFWDAYQEHPQAVISGIGDQYEEPTASGKPQVNVWIDPRRTEKYGTFYECNPSDIEWNWCSIPKKVMFEIGGFDEKLDFLGFGMDGYQVNERLDVAGYRTWLDQTNESFTLRHDRSSYGGEENWNKNNNMFNGNYQKRKQELIEKETWPKLHYLEKEFIAK